MDMRSEDRNPNLAGAVGLEPTTNGFGDRYSTLELHPYFKKVLSFLEPKTFLYDH